MGVLFYLRAKSATGKREIRDHGDLWRMTSTSDRVLFSNNVGPWYHVQSLKNPNHGRWINGNDDTNFRIIERIEVDVKL